MLARSLSVPRLEKDVEGPFIVGAKSCLHPIQKIVARFSHVRLVVEHGHSEHLLFFPPLEMHDVIAIWEFLLVCRASVLGDIQQTANLRQSTIPNLIPTGISRGICWD